MTTESLPGIHHPRVLLLATLAMLGCDQPPPPSFDESDIEEVGESESEGESESGDSSERSDLDGNGDGDGEGDTTTEGETGEAPETLYPLVDGAHWSYVVTNSFGQVTGTEVIDAHETIWEGQQAWVMVEEPGSTGEWDASTIVRDGELILRVHREEHTSFGTVALLDYTPGFARANDGWTAVGFMQELAYDRTQYDGNGQNPVVEARAHTYEVLAIDEPVTVPAGTFKCVKVERIRTLGAEAGALAWFWFAPGIGKVREERPIEMEIEELVSVTIPGGATYP